MWRVPWGNNQKRLHLQFAASSWICPVTCFTTARTVPKHQLAIFPHFLVMRTLGQQPNKSASATKILAKLGRRFGQLLVLPPPLRSRDQF